jgi:hypothetical protein
MQALQTNHIPLQNLVLKIIKVNFSSYSSIISFIYRSENKKSFFFCPTVFLSDFLPALPFLLKVLNHLQLGHPTGLLA